MSLMDFFEEWAAVILTLIIAAIVLWNLYEWRDSFTGYFSFTGRWEGYLIVFLIALAVGWLVSWLVKAEITYFRRHRMKQQMPAKKV